MAPTLTVSDLMSRTGYFFLYWSMFEQALGRAIIAARKRLGEPAASVRGGLKERLDLWFDLTMRLPENGSHEHLAGDMRDQALLLRDVRNLIVHGLAGASAMPEDGSPGHIRCIVGGYDAPTGDCKRYTMDDLWHFIQAADACRLGCEDPKRFNYRL